MRGATERTEVASGWLFAIPRVVHLFWGNGDLSFLRYLTLHTLAHLNPDWQIMLWMPSARSRDVGRTWDSDEHASSDATTANFSSMIATLPNVSIRHPAELDVERPDISPVFQSDLLRWRALRRIGGVWSDMDILYVKPLDAIPAIVNGKCQDPSRVDTLVCLSIKAHPGRSHGIHSIGFLGGNPGAMIWQMADDYADGRLNPQRYQSIGSDLMEVVCTDSLIKQCQHIVNLPHELVYPWPWFLIRDTLLPEAGTWVLGEPTIGLHWFGGDSRMGSYAARATPENFEDLAPGAVLPALIGQALARWPVEAGLDECGQ